MALFDAHFMYPWRPYQQRVLDELDRHLDDNHLHIVAPPGSGKTVLGLEVAVRIGKPTLFLAPSIAIRNQWVYRFCELFLQQEEVPDWISLDLMNPGYFTVATYQGLHSAVTNGANEVIARLQEVNLGTLVVDEAHHLKRAWWVSLTKVKEAIEPSVVGLTATPPYDVPHREWKRYIALNGPVDAEISVPELVKENNLCAHEDYICFSKPNREEQQKIDASKQRLKTAFDELCKDEVLQNAFAEHPIFTDTHQQLEWVYENLPLYTAVLSFLNQGGETVTEEHLAVYGDPSFTLPTFSFEWAELLITFYLKNAEEAFGSHALEHAEKWRKKLMRYGAMERGVVRFKHNTKITKMLSSSMSKLGRIEEIVRFEWKALQEELRIVVLTDYIRKEFLPEGPGVKVPLNKMGVVPIFEQLRRARIEGFSFGVLTGSLVIIPNALRQRFLEVTNSFGVERPSFKTYPGDSTYVEVILDTSLREYIVSIMTQLFEEGALMGLVGTKSLLGEGWDAPSINTLVLASFIGSYVSSNQMRGRAIRAQQGNKDKTSNVWHLVCLDPSDEQGGDDFDILSRRFRAFVGVSFVSDVPSIANGMERLGLPAPKYISKNLDEVNKKMFALAKQRQDVKAKWDAAIASGSVLVEEISVPMPAGEKTYKQKRSTYFRNTIAYFVASVLSALATFETIVFRVLSEAGRYAGSLKNMGYVLLAVGILGLVYFLPKFYKTARLFIKYRDIAKDFAAMGRALIKALVHTQKIKTPLDELEVVSVATEEGAVVAHLEGGTKAEQALFIEALEEMVGVPENPRYIIIRKSRFLQLIAQRDYHAVPNMLDGHKETATVLEEAWQKEVGRCKLLYTRSIEGRRYLVKARVESLAAQWENKPKRVQRWQ